MKCLACEDRDALYFPVMFRPPEPISFDPQLSMVSEPEVFKIGKSEFPFVGGQRIGLCEECRLDPGEDNA